MYWGTFAASLDANETTSTYFGEKRDFYIFNETQTPYFLKMRAFQASKDRIALHRFVSIFFMAK